MDADVICCWRSRSRRFGMLLSEAPAGLRSFRRTPGILQARSRPVLHAVTDHEGGVMTGIRAKLINRTFRLTRVILVVSAALGVGVGDVAAGAPGRLPG